MSIEKAIRKYASSQKSEDQVVETQGEWIVQKEGDWWTIRKKGRVFKCQTLEDARWLSLLLTIEPFKRRVK